jgi:hypothetical protein
MFIYESQVYSAILSSRYEWLMSLSFNLGSLATPELGGPRWTEFHRARAAV